MGMRLLERPSVTQQAPAAKKQFLPFPIKIKIILVILLFIAFFTLIFYYVFIKNRPYKLPTNISSQEDREGL